MNENLSRKINLFSLVFAMVVVTGHMIDVTLTEVFATKVFLRYISNLVAIGMGYFFFVSGYLFFRNFKMDNLIRKWKTRVKSLVIPFFIWNSIAFIEVQRLELMNGRKIWQCFFDINNLADGPLWYVMCLVCYVALAPIIYWIVKNKYAFWISWAILAVVNIVFNLDQGITLLYSLPFFWMGAGIATHYDKQFVKFADAGADEAGEKKHFRTWIWAIIAFLLLSGILLLFFFDIYADYHKYAHYLNRIVAPWLVFWCFRNCKIRKKYEWWKSSFFIYCGHEILIMEAMRHWTVYNFLFNYEWISKSIVGIGTFSIAVIGAMVALYVLLHRFCPKVCAVLSGGR